MLDSMIWQTSSVEIIVTYTLSRILKVNTFWRVLLSILGMIMDKINSLSLWICLPLVTRIFFCFLLFVLYTSLNVCNIWHPVHLFGRTLGDGPYTFGAISPNMILPFFSCLRLGIYWGPWSIDCLPWVNKREGLLSSGPCLVEPIAWRACGPP